MSLETIGSVVLKICKLILNFIVLIMYRTGKRGEFLGVGGSWDLNDERNPDVEIIASGIFVIYFIYTAVSLIGFFVGNKEHKKETVELTMNFIGMFMWIAIGATALHYWVNYLADDYYIERRPTEQKVGLAMGSLSVINGLVYILDTGLSFKMCIKDNM